MMDNASDLMLPDKNVTEEEFQNFMQRVTEVEKIVKKLASSDAEEQDRGILLADEILAGNVGRDVSETAELKIKHERTMINSGSSDASDSADPSKMSQDSFMRSVERDAKERAEDRKVRYERADTYKRIGNGAFGLGDYEKALTYYGKALEQRKDSSVLWNNRALSYMRLELYESALSDLEWALKVNNYNIKALLNSAKCHALLGNADKRDEFIRLARLHNPRFNFYINDFVKQLENEVNNSVRSQNESNSVD